MVDRPHKQAVRPHSARQRDTRWRFVVAGIVTLAVATGGLFLAIGDSPSTRGAEAPEGAGANDLGARRSAAQDARPAGSIGTTQSAVLVAVVDPSTEPVPTPPLQGRTLPWGWGAEIASMDAPAGQTTPVSGPTDPVDAAATARPGARPSSAPPTSKEPEELTGYGWPLYRGRMTNFFGPRDSGFLVVDGQRIHPGLDTTTFCGDQVRAAHAGVVVAVGRRFAAEVGFSGSLDKFYARIARNRTMGLQPIVVVVDDGNGYRSMYVHLMKALVKKGDRVTRRTVIGLEGDSGNASGCHVHYELVRMDGRWMRVAKQLVQEYGYPEWQRERVDPLRVLSLKEKRSGRFVPGILRPRLPESIRRPRKQPATRKPSTTESPADASPALVSPSP